MTSEQDIYEDHVLDHYEDPYHRGPLEGATHAHEADNPLCGDIIHIDLKLADDGTISEAWFDGKGCVISQASASMLIEQIEGKTLDEIRKFSAQDMLGLFGPKLTPNRQKCCLLSWRVLQSAVHAPIDSSDGDEPNFGGPSLGEES